MGGGGEEPIRKRDLMVDQKIFLRLKAYCVS